MTYILGLTGGIATGKSTVSRYFSDKGYAVVDADVVARRVVEPGTEGLANIVAHFGTEIIQKDGTLNREKLGAMIFSDAEKRETLNNLLSAQIRRTIMADTETLVNANQPLIVLDIPLLYEAGYETHCDAVMVVYTTEAVQLERLMARNNLTEEEALNRIASQEPIETKKDRADIVIDNNGPLNHTYEQVETWLKNNII
ncbi:dephospho-CoA kinase [Jeotgalibaca porci]|jgi:dephospho-CoA kinase|uniref:Dephospho-CoA kinase n=1 Tax=Jeotgalibaca porci TaxID=1868793 RepID=A0A6G7WG14_9LACT|nr:dephospho-CoA kinase [Jeotgalibaca porci]NLB98621.1 dephospho-CoA kinase [Lactobacillales bacterium]QIK51128.1 dephospho-CoA kinase [Jeotgalibaca porci]